MKRISPFTYFGSIQSCTSKSHAQRILILGLLSRRNFLIENFFHSECGEDVRNMITILTQLGHEFVEENTGTYVKAPADAIEYSIDSFSVGESGFALRTLSTVMSKFLEKYEILGTKTILERNHLGLINSLKKIGFQVSSNQSGLPIVIATDKTLNSNLYIDGSEGSQFLSGLLMLCPFLSHDTHISVEHLKSKPYIDLTIKTIEQFHGTIEQTNYSDFRILGNQRLYTDRISVDGDWSNMAFHFVGAALNGDVEISGLSIKSKQADEMVLGIVEDFGAILEYKNNKLRVKNSKRDPIHVSLVDAPDLFPVIAVLACGAIGKSRLTGISRLLNKESNRLESICNMLEVFQVRYEVEADDLCIFGKGTIKGGHVITYGDHRIAMAAVTASTIANSDISIDDSECVQKSYRNYFRDMYIMLN